uniref:Elongation of very long chain fatty acids protein n=2 Tax=Culex pipiens TaxID=7175 RepID=A0A8D8DA39_CULPI
MDPENSELNYFRNVSGFADLYRVLVHDLADDRVKHLPMVHSPLWILSCLGIYLLLVLRTVPKWMQNRKPFRLKSLIIVYDSVQIVGNGFSLFLFYKHGWSWRYFYECRSPDFSNNEQSLGFVHAAYFTYLLKIMELMETVMYAFRKKNSQISFFHVYHHCYACVTAWGFTKYGGGSMLSYTIMVNCIVHVFMYTYYLSSAIADRLPFSLKRVKKFVTTLQIVQLLSVLVNIGFALRPSCAIPLFHCLFHGPNMVFQIKMFVDFYRAAYLENKKKVSNKKT